MKEQLIELIGAIEDKTEIEYLFNFLMTYLRLNNIKK